MNLLKGTAEEFSLRQRDLVRGQRLRHQLSHGG